MERLFFKEFGLEQSFENGVLGRSVNSLLSVIKRLSSRLNVFVSNSAIISYPAKAARNLLYISLRSYGIMLFILGGINIIATLITNGPRDIMFTGAIGAVIAGVVFIVINRSVAKLFNGSIIAVLFGQFFGLSEIKEGECYSDHYALFTILGVALGILSIFTDVMTFAMVLGGLFGGLVILNKTEAGIFITAFCAAILPTKFILGLAVATVASFLIKVFITGKIEVKFELIDLFMAMFAILLAYSVFISYFPMNSAVMVATYLLFILFGFAVRNTINTREKLFALIAFIVTSGAIVSLYGIFQYMTGSYIRSEAWLDTDMFEGAVTRIYSTLENPNVLGEYLLFIIPLAFAMLYYYKEYLNKFVALAIFGAACLCMIFTQSRGAWLGLLLGMGIFVFLHDRRLLWLALIALLAAPFLLPESIIERFLSIGNMSDGSTSYRVNIWLASILMITTFWPIGIGLGTDTFIFIYRKYAFNAVNAPHSHNLFLQIVIDIGIFGLIIFAGIMCTFYKNLLVGLRKSNDGFMTALGAGLCAGMTGYLIQGLTDNVWFNYRIVIFFWMIVALAGAFIGIAKRGGKSA